MTNYHDYLQLDKILSSQQPLNPEAHDEMLFITVHQSYELWFKQILHELRLLSEHFVSNALFDSITSLNRVLTILKSLVQQTDILETMGPVSFTRFRSHLGQASGMQSVQFREIEFTLGAKNPMFIERYPEGSSQRKRLQEALNKPSINDYFIQFLALQFPGRLSMQERDFTKPYLGNELVVELLHEIYLKGGAQHILCESLVDLDEGFMEWRYRHVKMVERTIGQKMGTGGTSGFEYLKSSLFRPIFVDLWALRDRL